MSKTSTRDLLLFLAGLLHLAATTTGLGVNYGTIANNLPPPAEVANFLKTKTIINAIKLFDANPDILRAFANTNISVTVSVGNGDIPNLVQLPAAKNWVAANIAPFYPQTKIIRILVGNEIIHMGNRDWIYNLVPAMKSMNTALMEAGFKHIKLSTPNTPGCLGSSEPPSQGRFRMGYDKDIILPMLQFLSDTKSAFMINPYPYFLYNPTMADYMLFKKNKGIYDNYTKLTYYNMFDAQMDSLYSAMKAIGFADVPIVVAETGWPSAGDPDQPAATLDNAATFNWQLVKRVTSGIGTPLMPKKKFETYIFALFNENQKPGPTSERNFGLFRPDFTPVYDAGVMLKGSETPAQPKPEPGAPGEQTPAQPKPEPGAPGRKWCVPRPNTSNAALQENLDWICIQGIDCGPIQPGGVCFQPNTLWDHAQYAMNAYYSANGRNDFNCDFKQTGQITINNPSRGNCEYA